eukprot:10932-Heterococcus_DN1.PRE.4
MARGKCSFNEDVARCKQDATLQRQRTCDENLAMRPAAGKISPKLTSSAKAASSSSTQPQPHRRAPTAVLRAGRALQAFRVSLWKTFVLETWIAADSNLANQKVQRLGMALSGVQLACCR